MGFLEKFKLLFKVQKPIGEIAKAVSDVKKTKKWLQFSVTVLGSLAATAGALTGVISPVAQLVAVTVLQAAYNILRGADKAEDSDVKGTLRTTEFWTTGLAEIQKGLVAVQTGGVNAEWLASATLIVGYALSFGQNLSSRTLPSAPAETEKK